MDKIYQRKLLKMAIATPLALSVALVLDIDPGLSFLGPLMVFNIIWLFPDPIDLKRLISLKLITLLLPISFVAAFMAGLWGINSIVLLMFILLAGWGNQTWMPSAISLGLVPTLMFLAVTVLNSSAPYTTTVYLLLLFAISLGLGWLVERLFWPILAQQSIERKFSKTFRIFQNFSDRAFFRSDQDRSSLKDLTAQADSSIRATKKALKIVAMTSSLPPSDRNAREAWISAIAIQARLLAHLLVISRLLQDNWENPLLHELTTELSALGESLSATFAGLSVAIVNQHPGKQLPNPDLEFQRWQNKLNNMRAAGTTQSYNLTSRLAVGLIEHRLAGLSSDLSKILSWLETSRSDVPNDLPLALEPTW